MNEKATIECLMRSVSDRPSGAFGWHKLGVRERRALLAKYAQDYCCEKNLGPNDLETLKSCLWGAMRRNRLVKASDVTYDKDLNRITDLPMLVHNVELMSFKLARNDNRRRATDSLPYFHRQKV